MALTASEKLRVAAFLMLLCGVTVALAFLPVGDALESLSKWAHKQGFWGVLAYAGIFAASNIIVVPEVVLTAAAGWCFGLGWGVFAVVLGGAVGSVGAFLVGRYLCRSLVETLARKRPTFRALDDLISERAVTITLLLRLPYLGSLMLNYLLSLTSIDIWTFLWCTVVGMLPGMVFFVYLGSEANDIKSIISKGSSMSESDKVNLALIISTATLFLGVVIALGVYARRRVRAYVELQAAAETDPLLQREPDADQSAPEDSHAVQDDVEASTDTE